ncbi:3-oxoacyl-ACP synthase [Tepidimicrobium xylanilyticum]|uniref:3-oxoacyl-[acyl-carrier-protein] synthase-3 n=1 Tax=Tepidimicrobium xylanilyticum TaxID=1123352 RepID=A0A1H3DEU6_9FIRM|nr:3-oxoacyl-ACP synthase [Tepidimicrobium xylanilyticum]SDX64916.1 3-oxoacyl-[acyl-carrier-protein] synthase-3 [Tepidimicrobium xylanilyticum]
MLNRYNQIENKFGIKQKHRAGKDELVSDMAIKACQKILENFDPMDLDLVVYCGSEHKDYYLMNMAAKIQYAIGAKNANSFEIHSLYSAGVISLQILKNIMLSNSDINNVLLVSSSKETSLINYKNERSRFMFNFGDGAVAVLLQKGYSKNIILETHMITDGSFADDVAVYNIGNNIVDFKLTNDGPVMLDVKDPQSMKERLDPITLDNFISVITKSIEKSGYTVEDIDFIAPIFMKRSILLNILEQFNLTEENSFVLEDYGHCQSADAFISIVEGRRLNRIKDGDLVVMLGAGTGYTWAATTIKWSEYDEVS